MMNHRWNIALLFALAMGIVAIGLASGRTTVGQTDPNGLAAASALDETPRVTPGGVS